MSFEIFLVFTKALKYSKYKMYGKLWSNCQHGIKNNFILLFWFTNLMDLIVIKITVYEKIVYSNQKHMHSILKQIWQLQTYTRDYKNPTTKTIKFN